MSEHSPTSTTKYMSCPRFYDLSQRWQAKRESSPARIIGSAVALGLARFYQKHQDYEERAFNLVNQSWKETDENPMDYVESLVSRGIKLGIKTGLQNHEIVAVERDLGHAIPDLVYRGVDRGLRIIDHKVRLRQNMDYYQDYASQYDHSWQFAHYVWKVRQVYNEPVMEVGAHIIILGPRPEAKIHWVSWTQEALKAWYLQALDWWATLEDNIGKPYKANYTNCQRFGLEHRCEMYDICHIYNGNEGYAEGLFKRIS